MERWRVRHFMCWLPFVFVHGTCTLREKKYRTNRRNICSNNNIFTYTIVHIFTSKEQVLSQTRKYTFFPNHGFFVRKHNFVDSISIKELRWGDVSLISNELKSLILLDIFFSQRMHSRVSLIHSFSHLFTHSLFRSFVRSFSRSLALSLSLSFRKVSSSPSRQLIV